MSILDNIDKLYKELVNLSPLSKAQQRKLDEKFRLEFNYNSNHLEGNTLTYGETKLLLIFGETNGSHEFREYEEMKAHDVAYELIKEWANQAEHDLLEKDIKNLNEIILVQPFWKEAITEDGQTTRRQIQIGNYKEQPNSVRLANGEIFEYTSPLDTPIAMQELMDWYNTEKKNLHPLTLAAMLHYKFVRIHPFDDGNGRLARLLLNYVLLKNGYTPVVIKSDDKKNYLQALHLADVGEYEAFVNYIGEQLLWSLDLAVRAANGEKIDEQDDINKSIFLFKKELKIKNSSIEKKTYDNVVNILANSGVELFERIKKTLYNFNELFHDVEVRYTFTQETQPDYDIDKRSGGLTLYNTTTTKLIDFLDKGQYQLKTFGIEYHWKGYKPSTPAFEIGVFTFFRFDEYSYTIENITSWNKRERYVENHYDSIISENDIQFIITDIAQDIMREIKQRSFID